MSKEIKSLTEKNRRQPSKAAKQRVRDHFDAATLAHLCTTWDFDSYARRIELEPNRWGEERFFYYKDNGSDILAVAHLDSVQSNGTCAVVETAAGLLACSGTLDDRLGVYVILELLPALGITCDWLLTTDEEMGRSTADEFFPDHKSYNWIIQFDRGGTDVVMYQYERPELVDLVEQSGARVGVGSYSDICVLDHLGVAGFNWGVGYEDYHGERAHAWLEDTFRMVARFEKFYKANATKKLAYQPTVHFGTTSGDRDFWERSELDVAECGHLIDFGDAESYVEFDGGSYIVCAACGIDGGLDSEAAI